MPEPMVSPETRGAFDVRCAKCGKRFGWIGRIADRPPCPQCKAKNPANMVSMKRLPSHPERPIQNVMRTPTRQVAVSTPAPLPGNVVMPFGKHRGETLGEIAASDAGLLYLDWLVGQEWFYEKDRDLSEAVGQVLSQYSDRVADLLD